MQVCNGILVLNLNVYIVNLVICVRIATLVLSIYDNIHNLFSSKSLSLSRSGKLLPHCSRVPYRKTRKQQLTDTFFFI